MGIFKSISSLFNKNKLSTLPVEILDECKAEIVDEFISGDYATHFSTGVLLKKGEKLIFDIPNIQLCEEKTIKIKGSHSGFSVRLMKGVSYRFGGFEAAGEKRIVPLDSGNFILTTKRLIFTGSKKSMDCSLSRIVAITPVDNGILIDRSGRQNVEYFIGLDSLGLTATITPDIEQGHTWKKQDVPMKLDGFDIKKIIQACIQTD